MILILDFGSQYTQLIARKIRELNFYSEIHPYLISISKIKEINPSGIILSGGPSSVYEDSAPKITSEIFKLEIPILGICYGLQLIVDTFSGKVIPAEQREYGKATLNFKSEELLLKEVEDKSIVWMSHGDKVSQIPDDFIPIATTESSPYAIIRHNSRPIFGMQFHPEVHHSQDGKKILKNFCHHLCNLKSSWTMDSFAQTKIDEIKKTVGKERVLLGLSGGVDSTVVAKLLHDAIGDQLTPVYVDNGLMRQEETSKIIEQFQSYFKIKLEVIYAEKIFLSALKNISNPEQKRKIIGELFVQEFDKRAKVLGYHKFLAQGTLYTDIIESVSVKGPSETIKSHHNRVNKILDLIKDGRLIEPLKELFKDEVRNLGKSLGIPNEMLYRHPFPGPGLAIRIMGSITPERLDLLRQADAILIEELQITEQYDKIWQAFAVFLPIYTVGVMGDKRTYENVIALRMVESIDGMTADFAHVPYDILGKISNRIINEVKGINRVVFDISSKPPATIEWE